MNALINIIINVNWKTLASEVGIKEGDIAAIDGNCKLDPDPFRCCIRKMIRTLCHNRKVNELRGLPCEIAAALDRIENIYEADNVRTQFPSANCAVEETKLNETSTSNIDSGIFSKTTSRHTYLCRLKY